jgi:hypothetical protein
MVFELDDDSAAPNEIAEFAIWGDFDIHPTTSALWDTALNALAHSASDKWSALIDPTHYSHGAKLKQSRAIRVDAAGHTANEQVAAPGTAWTGDATAHSLPWADSLVISLYTYTPGSFIAHAGRRRGRIYLPPPNVSILETTNQGTVHVDTSLAILNDFKGWLHDVQLVIDPETLPVWVPGVLSKVGGNWNHVTDLAIDTKIDHQRRRERSQPATRSSVSYPA